MPAATLARIKCIFTKFVWGDYTYGREKIREINYDIIRKPWKKGGLGLVTVELKLKAFRIQMVVKLVLEHYDKELQEKPEPNNHLTQPPWKNVFPTWCLLPLKWCRRDINKVITLPNNGPVLPNNAGHWESRSRYWDTAMEDFIKYMEKYVPKCLGQSQQLIILKQQSTKKVYDRLLNEYQKNILIPVVTKNVGAKYEQQWLDCENKYIRPFLRNFMYRCAHECLPTNERIHKTKKTGTLTTATQAQKCELCQNESETVGHALLHCQRHSKIWFFLENKFFQLCNHRLKITEDILFRGGLTEVEGLGNRDALLLVINTVASCIWKTRNEFVKEGKQNNLNRRTANAIRTEIKLQVAADKKRLPQEYFESRWVPWVCHLSGINQLLMFSDWIENMSAEVESSQELDTSTSSLGTPSTPALSELELSSQSSSDSFL